MSFVIGVSAYYHDSSIALMENGTLVDFVKEESLTRVKGDRGFPARAIRLLITRWGLEDSKIDKIVFYERPLKSWLSLMVWCAGAPLQRWKLGHNKLSSFFSSGVFFESEIRRYFQTAPVVYADHHRSHAMNALYFSKRPADCLILVLDSFGEGASGGVFDSKLACVRRFDFPHSIGFFYSAITDYCGFQINEGESKLMGLAALGKPIYVNVLRRFVKIHDGVPELNLELFNVHENPTQHLSDKGIDLLPALGAEPLSADMFAITANLAASAQQVLEETLIDLVRRYTSCHLVSEVVLSGGVALNVAAISKLAETFEDLIFTVPISPGDSGSALGAALQAYPKFEFSASDWQLFAGIRSLDFSNHKYSSVLRCCASGASAIEASCVHLLQGEPVALMTQKVEQGPRALGATSILFHSRSADARKIFNDTVKGRESYRPLAPVVLSRNFARFFSCPPNIQHLLKYMAALASQTDEFKSRYPGYAHADGTCRVQIIDQQEDLLYQVLEEFERLGEYVLINTSLNVAGDPMVYDEVDLVTSLRRMNMKYMLCEEGLYELVE